MSSFVPSSGIFLLDMNQDSPHPVKLAMEGPDSPKEFHPHGMTHWVEEKGRGEGGEGDYYIYVINHRQEGDAVEAFEYDLSAKRLLHRQTIRDPLFSSVNNLVAVGLDRFYVTVDRYFARPILQQLELHLRLALGYVAYYDGQSAMAASEGLRYPNGIAKSNDGRYWREGERKGGREGGLERD